jgi:hypothetical protein
LEFSIDWSKSYATKNSQRIKDFENYQCVSCSTRFYLQTDIHFLVASTWRQFQGMIFTQPQLN